MSEVGWLGRNFLTVGDQASQFFDPNKYSYSQQLKSTRIAYMCILIVVSDNSIFQHVYSVYNLCVGTYFYVTVYNVCKKSKENN